MFDQEFFDFSILIAFLAVFFIGNANCCPQHAQLNLDTAEQVVEASQQSYPSQGSHGHINTTGDLTDLATSVVLH